MEMIFWEPFALNQQPIVNYANCTIVSSSTQAVQPEISFLSFFCSSTV